VQVEEILPREGSGDESTGRPPLLDVRVNLFVERDSQKAIVIGKGGSRVKQLGIAARQSLSELFRCPVHLNLFVKVVPDWSNADAGLRKVGFSDLDGARK
jgi:GTP-binding protein Era